MNHKQRLRQPGEPLSSDLVKAIRLHNDLSQDEFAARLGLRGGKSVVSGWETGRTKCEGPAAELILKLFGESQSDAEPPLLSEADKVWKRVDNNFLSSWRQIAIIPLAVQSVAREAFVHLFPGVEIPPAQYAHGFPFVDQRLPGIYRLDETGWMGTVPVERNRPPHYFWSLKRDGAFVYREHRWEDDALSVTEGHIHFGAQFNITMAGVFFYKRLIERLRFDPERKVQLRLDLEGIEGRGVVAYQSGRPANDFTLDEPRGLSPKNHASFIVGSNCREIVEKPLQVGLALVGEFALALRPDLASGEALEEQLRKQHRGDDNGNNIRFLGFLDEIPRWRRARVAMGGVPVGMLFETQGGSRFEYDAAYLRRADAVPLSPTLPLKLKSFSVQGLHPFFANLLPEGTRLIWICQRKGLDPRDEFGILLATGRNAIGAVEIHAEAGARP
jgi:serine/threonine-protein kinase HipA